MSIRRRPGEEVPPPRKVSKYNPYHVDQQRDNEAADVALRAAVGGTAAMPPPIPTPKPPTDDKK